MIHTKELRFGNKVISSQGQVITVQQVLSNSVIYESKIEVNRELVPMGSSRNRDNFSALTEIVKEMDCADIMPISLNDDILRKCGFRHFMRDQWILKIGSTHFDWEFNNGKLRLRSTPSFNEIGSVHALQNFLFAIAGHELEFSNKAEVIL